MKQLNSNGTLKIKKERTYSYSTTFSPEQELEYLKRRFDDATKQLIRIQWYRIFKRAKLIRTINYCAKRIKELKDKPLQT